MAKKKKPVKRKPRRKELTGPQTISYSFGEGVLNRDYTKIGTYVQLRAVRKDPTVQLARALMISCIQAGSWNVEADDGVSEDVKDFIEHILPLRDDFLYNVVAYGKVDFGWQGFEKLFKIKDNRIVIDALKPLLHDMTHVLVTKHGRFNGYRQRSMGWGGLDSKSSGGPSYPIDLKVEKCIHTAFGVEAGNLYGMPLLENIRSAYDDWQDCNDGAKRYDLKLAGTHWVVKYPPGTATVDGETVDNGVVAGQILDALESSGSVSIPTTTATVIQELVNVEVANLYAWQIDLLDDKGKKQESFSNRLRYLDTQKVRGLLMPERSLLEGQHGTKAEAGVHTDLAITNIEATDRAITTMINKQLVNQLLQINFGDSFIDKVRIIPAPLIDKQITFLRDIYKELSKTDSDIDMQALRDKLNIATEEGGSERAPIPNFGKKDNNDE